MGRELVSLKENWSESPHFKDYKNACEKVTDEEDKRCLDEIEKNFFEVSLKTYRKHFNQWISPPLLSAMIGAESQTATMFASWLLEGKFAPAPVD